MNTDVRLKVDTGVRLRDFMHANPLDGQPVEQLVARFMEVVERAELLFTQQEAGIAASAANTERREELRRIVVQEPLRHVKKIGRAVAKVAPEVAVSVRRAVTGRSERAFQASLRAIIQEVERNKDLFLTHGMSEESLTQLTTLLATYEQAVVEGNAARRAHTGASNELRSLARELMQLMDLLDGVVRYRFRAQPELVGAWESARNVAWPLNQGSATTKQASA